MNEKKKGGILTSAAVMGIIILASKLLGLFRDILVARFYGMSTEAIAYSAASRIPVTIFDLVIGGVVTSAFIPVFNSVLVKKGKEEVYCWTEEQREDAALRLGKGSDKGYTVQRYKGLGEMSDEQLWDTTMNPEKRRLRKITIENAAQAERTFSMLMGDDVPPRRQFIEENAHYANIDA